MRPDGPPLVLYLWKSWALNPGALEDSVPLQSWCEIAAPAEQRQYRLLV